MARPDLEPGRDAWWEHRLSQARTYRGLVVMQHGKLLADVNRLPADMQEPMLAEVSVVLDDLLKEIAKLTGPRKEVTA